MVDNASGDGHLASFAAAHSGVRFVENDGNWGFADGCNRGAREARGAFLLFFNPDAEDPGGGIEALVAQARSHSEAAIVTARQVDERGRAQKVFDAFPSIRDAVRSRACRSASRRTGPVSGSAPRSRGLPRSRLGVGVGLARPARRVRNPRGILQRVLDVLRRTSICVAVRATPGTRSPSRVASRCCTRTEASAAKTPQPPR